MRSTPGKRQTRKAILGWGGSLLALGFSSAAVRSQDAAPTARVLDGDENRCPVLEVNLNQELSYLGSSSSAGGRSLSVLFQNQVAAISGEQTEPIVALNAAEAHVRGMTVTHGEQTSTLRIDFDSRVDSNVFPSAQGHGVSVQVAGPDASGTCRNTVRSASGPSGGATEAAGDRVDDRGFIPDLRPKPAANLLSPEDQVKVASAMAQARTAITAKDYPTAIRRLTKVLSYPENKHTPDAQEMLGVVRERNGQFAHAKAEYEIYLEKYPTGEGAVRVRQRLEAIRTAEAAPPERLREATGVHQGTRIVSDDPQDAVEPQFSQIRMAQPSTGRAATARIKRPADEFPKIERWGSIDTTYYYNQGTTRLTEYDTSRTTVDDFVYQNTLVTSADFFWSKETRDQKLSFRFAGANDSDLIAGAEYRFQLSRLYARLEQKTLGLTYTFGRQSITRDGVFGRFDGLHVAWQAAPKTLVSLQVGAPVFSVRDRLFDFNRVLFGASVKFQDIRPNTDLSFYAVQQNAGAFIDRQAVGLELDYQGPKGSVYAVWDYDTYFQETNFARATATWTFPDDSSVTVGADYLQSPTLSLSNALVGQASTTLDQLSTIYTEDEMKQLARDRTTASSSITLAYSRPLNPLWQMTIDATLFHTDGNPASGGVPKIDAPGTEFFTSAGFYGNGIFRPSDVVSATVRFADTASSTLYLVDSYYRFRLNEKVRLQPRLKVGYRDLTAGGNEFFAIPSIKVDYEVKDKTFLEVELGDRWSSLKQPTFKQESNEVFAFLGLRYEF